MGALSWLLGTKRIPADTLGVLDLSGGAASELAAADKAVLGPLFRQTRESARVPPACNVLLVYATFTRDGRIESTTHSLREIIKKSGAPIVIVATPNDGECYRAAAKQPDVGRANLVLTLDRNGPAFVHFFAALFADMKQGTSMPRAWVKLAPQAPGRDHPDCPETMFLCELGQVALS